MKNRASIPSKLTLFLWHFAKRYKLSLLGFSLIAIFWGANLSLTSYAMKMLTDRVSSWDQRESLFSAVMFPALLYIGLGLSVGVVFRFYDWLKMKTFPEMKAQIIEELFNYVEKHSYSYFQHHFAGSLGSKIDAMAKSAASVISTLIDNFLAGTLSVLIGTGTMFLVHPYFACILIVWAAIFMSVSLLFSKRAKEYSESFSQARSKVVGKIVDSIGNILNVKLFARERYENRYLRKYLDEGAAKDRAGSWYLLKVNAFYSLSMTALTAAMMALLVYERSQNQISVGDFALVLTLNMFLIDEVFFLANQLVSFSEDVGTCQEALSAISSPHEIKDHPDAKILRVTEGQIVFDKVHFSYPEGKKIFSGSSITINPGEKVGLVGFSGSGKSTFVNLLLRFFEIDSGKISIDGQDIQRVTQESLRSQISMIPQEPLLFHRSLLENMSYGQPGASEAEIIACSKKAHCHEFIQNLPEGYSALVGERGVKLSGGQRQRIAIARAILKNAPILILDEATSALDSVTESYIQESLAALMEKKTVLVIAHRLSTLAQMDRILVFHEGAVVEEGSHLDLLAQEGRYAELWKMQVKDFFEEPQEEVSSI